MKLSQIKEMAIKGGHLRKLANDFADKHKHEWFNFPHVADIDDMEVRHFKNVYVLFKDANPIAHFQVDAVAGNIAIVDGVWVAEIMSNKKVFSRFLWFLKSREHYSKIQLGDVHSHETYQLLIAGGLSRFQKYWKNSSTGEIIPYDVSSVEDFYRSSKWKLFLESHDDSFDDFPRFNGGGWIKESYEWQIE